MLYSEEEWHQVRLALEPFVHTQPMKNLVLFLTHSRIWIEQLQLTTPQEDGTVTIRADPIDIERLMERKILSLWNKLTPQNFASIQAQLEGLPLEITEERLRSICERFVATLQVNHAYASTYMSVLGAIEKKGSWKDSRGRKMSEVLLPMVAERLASHRAPGAMDAWVRATAGEGISADELFEWQTKWKRNFQSMIKAVLYGVVHKLWADPNWFDLQKSVLTGSEADLEAWLAMHQAWRKEGGVGGMRPWQGSRPLLLDWKGRVQSSRLRFLIDDALDGK